MSVSGIIQRYWKPVSLADGFSRYRYILSKQESRIRVSGTTLLREFRFRAAGNPFTCFLPAVSSPKFVYILKSRTLFTSAVCFNPELQLNTSPEIKMPEKKPFERLPRTVIPNRYKLYFKPDFKKFTFDGKETVQVTVNEPTNKIVLNAEELTISKAEVKLPNGTSHVPEISQKDDVLSLLLPAPLPVGDAEVNFEFTGVLNDKLKGFYRSKCQTVDGEEQKYVAVTQFEATDARWCFPCWDEPAIKSVFDITITAPPGKIALSNMPVASEVTEPDGSKTSTFETTPIMSTYLVAMIVGEFDYVEDHSKDGVLVRVYTPVGKKEQGKFALSVATKVLPFYKDYFGIAYPLPKIDLVTIADFAAGAMENWGLVTYRETCLLVDPQNTSTVNKQFIALVVGHELAHQWFGNLVTMEWWTHLWLNEGYASFVEYLCVAYLFPEYGIWTQFVTDVHIRALELDSLETSHPIEVPVGHPSEIDEIFDDISYNKGACVIRMLHKYIGDENFRKGMNIYLTRHQNKNTMTEDLWDALQEASSKPVRSVMSTWTRQMGFPMVTVENSVQEGNSRVLTISQSKFYAAGNKIKNGNSGDGQDGALWMVPIMFIKSGDPKKECHSAVLQERSMRVTIDNIKPDEWVKLNPGTVGFYRTCYPSHLQDKFLPSIQDKSMPPLDRLGLLDDLFALVQAGHSSTVQVLKLMLAMTHEDNFTVWSTISNCLGKLGVLLSNTDFEDSFKAYGRKLLKDVGNKLGWEPKPNESHLDTLLRSLVLGRLAVYGDKEVIAEAQKRFEDYVAGKSVIPADLRSPIYKAVMTVGDESTYKTMLKLYRDQDLHEEKDRICRAFGAIKDKNILSKVLQFSVSDEVRSQDTVFVVISVAMNKVGRDLAWNFMKDNWDLFFNRYQGVGLLSRLVKHVNENFANEDHARAIESFFATHETAGIERSVQQTCESIRLNAAWLKRDREHIREFLSTLS
ncbi:puromycin-sensitive aminopeptidase isoform X2 [Lycorma delicatula]|uniref:puromycin-sensitive aminopeptidase isoform X2 n=1 Tax=Lycorma delicatula TaxID=130591 RepID=UPI003F512850